MSAEAKRVLIVDDDRDFVEAIACFLEANGFAVSRAHSGEEGLRQAKLERPDLIIMDIMMSDRTEGFFAISDIRRDPALKKVPIFLVSGLCTHLPAFEIPDGAWMAHDVFFSKPVDTGQLLQRIRQWTAQAP